MPLLMPCSHVASVGVIGLVLVFVGVAVLTSLSAVIAGVLTSAVVCDVVAWSLSVVGTLALVSVVACSSAGGVAV